MWRAGRVFNEAPGVSERYPCPCCGHRVLDAMPGSFEICPICFWEDDDVQFRWPTAAVGANRVSLIEAQRNYQSFGACDQHGRKYVRPPAEDEPLDHAWRPIDPERNSNSDPASCGNQRQTAGSRKTGADRCAGHRCGTEPALDLCVGPTAPQ